MKVALVHDYLTQYGGGERVLEAFTKIWPQAPIYTLIYDAQKTGHAFVGKKIYTSFLQKWPLSKSHHRLFSALMPLGIEQFDFAGYDVVLSDSASYAKGVITRPDTLHLCYCHTPIRYAWDDSHRYIKNFGYNWLVRALVPPLINYIRLWDEAAAQRPDHYAANSHYVARRIKKYYRQEALVINPPIKTDVFRSNNGQQDYFLAVGRFLPYKRFDLVIAAFNSLGLPLKIIGSGPQARYLRQMARPNIEFVGLVSDQRLRDYYAGCRALIFPQEEDFGIVACEAMAAGRPVVAYRAGGALEIIQEGRTGVFFDRQETDSLVAAVKKCRQINFDRHYIRQQVLGLDEKVFQAKIKNWVEEKYQEFKANRLRPTSQT
ncbi:MAG: glycosyltransferase family 4 protein [Candidatus Portnoybacteria bacterium CG10_big_fil_rev_8_21_14_0_10_44_7]|uniref:Glycosyltransferase family 4 protein n=1 Tax=Candidatus Portnoybacteria bacterium CG10_big_fil_rev_8_21_14_0_10_44_7 TaxID=1974816 RepID=A0A2M8KJH4_9BACT|nr:MAG: glycosyltransferase family 4 protein [Candidatus Portnoybacteria bacterium CG10_big_fil_rev_8_21_14_0_10_44_7]